MFASLSVFNFDSEYHVYYRMLKIERLIVLF